MKLYYHKTDGGAEYYCTKYVDEDSAEGDMRTAILRVDGKELELNTYKLAQLGIDVIIKS